MFAELITNLWVCPSKVITKGHGFESHVPTHTHVQHTYSCWIPSVISGTRTVPPIHSGTTDTSLSDTTVITFGRVRGVSRTKNVALVITFDGQTHKFVINSANIWVCPSYMYILILILSCLHVWEQIFRLQWQQSNILVAIWINPSHFTIIYSTY